MSKCCKLYRRAEFNLVYDEDCATRDMCDGEKNHIAHTLANYLKQALIDIENDHEVACVDIQMKCRFVDSPAEDDEDSSNCCKRR